MVKTVAAKINDELFDETQDKLKSFDLSNSQMVRYAFAIVCGYSVNKAVLLAKFSPDLPLSQFNEGWNDAS